MADLNPNRRRRRNTVSDDDRVKIAKRVIKFYDDEWGNRKNERDARLQRYAKFRMWSNGTDSPWPDASDVAIPDMLQDSLRVQDTLVNAVMSQRPPVVSRATTKEDADKQEKIDRLIEYQFFVENPGEKLIGEMAEAFVNDPACTVFVPWVKEERTVADVTVFDEIPDGTSPRDYFFGLLRRKFPTAKNFDEKGAGWDWTVTNAKDEKQKVCFYSDEDDKIEMVVQQDQIVFDGPVPMVVDYDDVIFPARSANLQMPGPSNPGGAPFVILRSFPILAELKKLQQSGFYDLLKDEELTKLETAAGTTAFESESRQQKDKLQGANENPGQPEDASHKRFTRLTCFDTYDIDGDGYEEDVIAWVIKETGTLLKMRLLSDMYPGSPPRRPFEGDSFLPVGGRYSGMSQLEIMEALHDVSKVIVDQMVNANDLAIASPGWYRPAGGMNPEVLRIEPFTISPLQNPQQDISFPPIGNPQAMSSGMNMLTVIGQWQDKITMVGDFNFGQVPSGSSSALRTIGGMSMVQGQSEARPERILRRFFMILTGVWKQIHRLNQSFLPKGKQFRIAGASMPGQDPYQKINSTDEIGGSFQFDFDANVLNTSKASLQQSLQALLSTYVNPLMIQLGVVKPDGIYRLARDFGRAQGQNVDAYLSPPSPDSMMPKLLAEEAIAVIIQGQMPYGAPLEAGGAQEHFDKLVEFHNGDSFGILTKDQVDLFGQYVAKVQKLVAQQAQQSQIMQSAGQFAQSRNPGQPGAPVTNPAAPSTSPPPISGPNEMINETLPSAGGGANQ